MREYWPWWIALFWLIGYELYALITRRATLSRLVWRRQRAWPGLMIIATLVVVTLWVHFFLWRDIVWLATGLILSGALAVYLRVRDGDSGSLH